MIRKKRTFISSWTCLCGCQTKLGKPARAFGLNLLSALLQMVSFVVIVGWVWSIIWGMNFVQIASESRRLEKFRQLREKREMEAKAREPVGDANNPTHAQTPILGSTDPASTSASAAPCGDGQM
ncbi:protein stum homolog [Elysia marginata]|uniref:Protein stum homolog n=1 Tax=Elysia marginata TaxID=1093978 RepID=A0AAV4F8B7_9GAST|nr:protein stum homolog [Elysia marginata]